jgi:hypothetical protein
MYTSRGRAQPLYAAYVRGSTNKSVSVYYDPEACNTMYALSAETLSYLSPLSSGQLLFKVLDKVTEQALISGLSSVPWSLSC